MRNPHGYGCTTHPETGRIDEHDTIQCCHCGRHVILGTKQATTPGISWCTMCHQTTCGNIQCQPCQPFQKALEQYSQRARLLDALAQ